MSLKIMVVDDEPQSPKLIRSLAAPLDHTVLAFEDSQAAGQRAESQRFDVAFVGMGTPQLDGLELARRIRKSPLNLETTIVMLGATDDVGSLRKAFGEGADFVLTKPIAAGRIRQMLAAMDSPGWKGKRHAARLPLITEVICTWDNQKFALRSLNISETGMLLQGSPEIAEGQEVDSALRSGTSPRLDPAAGFFEHRHAPALHSLALNFADPPSSGSFRPSPDKITFPTNAVSCCPFR